jgi:hypothetical protein
MIDQEPTPIMGRHDLINGLTHRQRVHPDKRSECLHPGVQIRGPGALAAAVDGFFGSNDAPVAWLCSVKH